MSNDQQACMMQTAELLDCLLRNSRHITTTVKLTDLYLMCCDYDALLFHAPSIPVDLGVELVVPSLPTLLANAPWEEGRDQAPLPFTIFLHQPAQHHLESADLPSSTAVNMCKLTIKLDTSWKLSSVMMHCWKHQHVLCGIDMRCCIISRNGAPQKLLHQLIC